MDGTCSMNERKKRGIIFWLGNLKGWDHSEDLGIDWDNIKMDLSETGWECVNWFYLIGIQIIGGLLWI